ncbi:hypothetical protein KSW81_002699 [Nannochloris sp. 'desiccata']|nr:hypothetical protein KSW81_002699 [Chlorella desiccata (nom. nud.)]
MHDPSKFYTIVLEDPFLTFAKTSKSFAGTRLTSAITNGTKCKAFFNFGNNNNDTPAMTRADYTDEEVTEYFNYMGMLAEEGTYDRLEEMLASGAHPCDLLLLMSAKEGDTPKVEELLGAGANPAVKDKDGKTPLDLCDKEEVKEMLQAALAKAS